MLSFHRIPNSHCVLIERLGKYARTQKAGLRFYVKGLEKIKRLDIEGSHWGDVANKESYLIELSEQNTNTHGSKAYTKDNVEVAVDASIFWQIINAKDAVYESDCLPMAISDRAIGVLRASIGVFDFDELSSKREQLSRDTTEALVESGKKWGVKFTRVEIQQLQTDGKTHEALLQQVEADRRKKAIIAEAEGNAERIRLSAEANKIEALTAAEADEQVQVLKAKGKRQAISLESQGTADQILNVARAQAEALQLTRSSEKEYLEEIAAIVGPQEAARLLLAQKYIDGFDNISRNPANKVFLPNNFAGAFNMNLEPPVSQPVAPAPATEEAEKKESPAEQRRRKRATEQEPDSEDKKQEERKRPEGRVPPKDFSSAPAPAPASPSEKLAQSPIVAPAVPPDNSPETKEKPVIEDDESDNEAEAPNDSFAETNFPEANDSAEVLEESPQDGEVSEVSDTDTESRDGDPESKNS